MTDFKPMLCPNESIDLSAIKYPLLASFKLDGIRCVFHPELGMVSRSLKPIPNKQLQEKFADLLRHVKQTNRIHDGEFYSHTHTFQEIQRACMTKDFTDVKTIKELGKDLGPEQVDSYVRELIDGIKYFCFDMLDNDDMSILNDTFEGRRPLVFDYKHGVIVEQVLVNSAEDVQAMFANATRSGYEGLILKDPNGKYKFGRGTVKEGLCYKVKPYIDQSAIIKGVVQATVVRDGAEKTINELGRSVTSKKKDDRVLIEKAAAFLVDWKGQDLKVVIAASDPEKESIWQERDQYVGKEVNFKSMEVGMKEGGLPRHPVATRWWKHDE